MKKEKRDRKEGSDAEDEPNQHRYNVARDRQKRQSKPRKRYGFADLVSYALTSASEVVGDEPQTYEKAIATKDSSNWIEAMESEINSVRKNQTWTLVDRPKK